MELGGKNELISAWTSPLCTSLILPISISLFSFIIHIVPSAIWQVVCRKRADTKWLNNWKHYSRYTGIIAGKLAWSLLWELWKEHADTQKSWLRREDLSYVQSTSAAVLFSESGLEAAGSQRTYHRCLSTAEAGWEGRGHSSLPWGVVAVRTVRRYLLPFKDLALSWYCSALLCLFSLPATYKSSCQCERGCWLNVFSRTKGSVPILAEEDSRRSFSWVLKIKQPPHPSITGDICTGCFLWTLMIDLNA